MQASERSKTHALDHAVTGIGLAYIAYVRETVINGWLSEVLSINRVPKPLNICKYNTAAHPLWGKEYMPRLHSLKR
jgi:hypothetical protein